MGSVTRLTTLCIALLCGAGLPAGPALQVPPPPDGLRLPVPGDHELRILSPTVLELTLTAGEGHGPGRANASALTSNWNFPPADESGLAPKFWRDLQVSLDGQPVAVARGGWKRRVRYAPVSRRDLRVTTSLYLELQAPLALTKGAPGLVTVADPTGLLGSVPGPFAARFAAARFSPVIHVNQEGYVPGLPKEAIIGYFLGDLGELPIPAEAGFSVVDTATGAIVYHNRLWHHPDAGYRSRPAPYQDVWLADFSDFRRPGQYVLWVPGLGTSWPFRIDPGIALGFARTYALGLYEQRSGAAHRLPFTRFTQDADHTAPAEVPLPADRFAFTWKTVAGYAQSLNPNNPPPSAPPLDRPDHQLYPFVRQGAVDVAGGHWDAGDYSKYTTNSAELIHYLIFAVDAVPGVAAMDHLGLPESGDGVSDVLQEAKWEADYLAKLQDSDGGFYFLVYPKEREYESNVLPEQGDPQVVWPKNTVATAAAVAALAQAASSPQMKAHYPAAAVQYLRQARLGWTFLTRAIARYGKAGAYQKITFYGDDWTHDDELAWAACELYLATGEAPFQQQFFDWFPDPANPATFRWGWWRMSQCWGNAIRSYAFAARSGRLPASALDPHYLAACEGQIVAAGDDLVTWAKANAYGTPFPLPTKAVNGAGWYFSMDQASDLAVAYLIDPKSAYLEALTGAMDYEAGTNPVNVSFVTGLGQERPREIVSQYAQNDRRVLPPSGLPLGNIQASFDYLGLYGSILKTLSYPSDNAPRNPTPFYDRWSDAFNVTTEYIAVNQARSLLAYGFLAHHTGADQLPWVPVAAQIVLPTGEVPLDQPVQARLVVTGRSPEEARIVWEGRDQEPAYGATFALTPRNSGPQWVEAEAAWPDGERAFAAANFSADSAVVQWLRGQLPEGAVGQSSGGDTWDWIEAPGAPFDGGHSHRAAGTAAVHEHWFLGASSPLTIRPGDQLFVWVQLDPNRLPTEIMVGWHAAGTWEHRAYWGGDTITYGSDHSAGRRPLGRLPEPGRWVRLGVPAQSLGLEGLRVDGVSFSVVDGQVDWGPVGRAAAR